MSQTNPSQDRATASVACSKCASPKGRRYRCYIAPTVWPRSKCYDLLHRRYMLQMGSEYDAWYVIDQRERPERSTKRAEMQADPRQAEAVRRRYTPPYVTNKQATSMSYRKRSCSYQCSVPVGTSIERRWHPLDPQTAPRRGRGAKSARAGRSRNSRAHLSAHTSGHPCRFPALEILGGRR